mmetsp:Transcript_1839/g.5194  ORF Transcript_1839/g.5194 Transcript_1839/m.5194 type:complete len:303 (-) Transcript_1839:356-1264(-)
MLERLLSGQRVLQRSSSCCSRASRLLLRRGEPGAFSLSSSSSSTSTSRPGQREGVRPRAKASPQDATLEGSASASAPSSETASSSSSPVQLPDLSEARQQKKNLLNKKKKFQGRSEKKRAPRRQYLSEYRRNVGLCVVDESTGLVFAARRVDDSKGTWQMPQGGIDAGEEPREAALRELEEETGIRPGSVRFVAEMSDWLCYDFPTSVKSKTYLGQRQKWFLLKMNTEALRAEGKSFEDAIDLAARGEEHREFSEWCWMPLDRIAEQIVYFKRDVYESVAKEFSPLIKRHFNVTTTTCEEAK